MAHPSESGHWYKRDGSPCYEVPYADPSKGIRPVTLADARKLTLYPGSTSIIREANKPGLERWKQEQVLLAALTLPRKPDEPEAEWIKRVFEDSQEQAKKAGEKGITVHAAIQSRDASTTHIGLTLDAHFGHATWVSEKSFAHPLGFGGKVDDHCDIALVDYKTTDKPLETLKTWDEHYMQLASYREGLGKPDRRCAIVYVNVNDLAQIKIMEIPEDKLQRGWAMFKALLDYWYARTGLARTSNA